MRRRTISIALSLLAVAALAGCGQKGPLVLPTRPAAPASTAATPAPAASASKPAGAASAAAPASAARGG